MTPAAEVDLVAQFMALHESYERAWECVKAMTLCKSPGLAGAMLERADRHLAEVAHRAAELRIALRPTEIVDPAAAS